MRRAEVRRIAIASGIGFLLAWLCVTWLTINGLYGDPGIAQDLSLYRHWAGEVLILGQVPFVDFGVDYPPLAIASFLIPALIAGPDTSEPTYRLFFQAEMALFGIGMTVVVVLAAAALGGARRELLLAGGLAAASPLLMGGTILARYDMLPVFLTAVAIWCVATGRWTWSAIFIGLGAAAKLYPILLAPFVAVHLWRRDGLAVTAHWAAVLGLVVLLILGPFFALSPDGVVYTVFRQFERPLQIEAFAAVVLMLLNEVAGLPVLVTHTFDSWNLEGPLPSLLATVQIVASLGVLGLIGWRLLRGPATRALVIVAMAAAMTIYVAFGKAFSPQYVLWLVPFVAVLPAVSRGSATTHPARAELATVGTLVVVIALTSLYYPGFYWPFVNGRELGWTLVILARNLLLAGLGLYLVRALFDRGWAADAATRHDPEPAAR